MTSLSVRTLSGLQAYREAGSGPVVVLLHAFPLDSEMWLSQVQAFSDRFRILVPDVAGLGASPELADLTVDRIATSVHDLLDALKISEPIVLGGLSMGGYAALAFARLFPKRLRAMILSDTKADADDEAGKTGRDKMIKRVQKEGVLPVIEQLLPKLVSAHTLKEKPEVVQRVRDIANRQSRTGVVSALKALRNRSDARPSLSSIGIPTLVIVGEDDVITPPVKALELQGGIPQAKLAHIPLAGHLASLENETDFNHAVGSFLEDLNSSGKTGLT